MKRPSLKPGTEEVIEHFLAEKLRKTGAKGYVLGLSGGLDSAVVLKLASRAVGSERVLAVMMPEKDSPKEDRENAEMLCEAEGVLSETVGITDMVAAFSEALGEGMRREWLANIKARCRMILLYYYAGQGNRLVLGTSNKSELLVGYFTKYGDGGADIEPIGDLYKTEVRQLARQLDIPQEIIDRAPSAGLWKGQTDEEEIGLSYEYLDAILLGIELGKDENAIAQDSGMRIEEVRRISEKVRLSSHKRKFPAVAKIGVRTPGLDWREGDEDI